MTAIVAAITKARTQMITRRRSSPRCSPSVMLSGDGRLFRLPVKGSVTTLRRLVQGRVAGNDHTGRLRRPRWAFGVALLRPRGRCGRGRCLDVRSGRGRGRRAGPSGTGRRGTGLSGSSGPVLGRQRRWLERAVRRFVGGHVRKVV